MTSLAVARCRWIPLGVVALALGCSRDPVAPRPDLPGAPSRIVIDGRAVSLRGQLSRNFMPIAPEGGPPLSATAIAGTVGGSDFPAGVEVEHLWLANGPEVWSVAAAPRTPPYVSSERWGAAWDGPKWEPGTRVTLVVRLTRGDDAWYLRADDQVVGAVY